jgi:hypothetical protein
MSPSFFVPKRTVHLPHDARTCACARRPLARPIPSSPTPVGLEEKDFGGGWLARQSDSNRPGGLGAIAVVEAVEPRQVGAVELHGRKKKEEKRRPSRPQSSGETLVHRGWVVGSGEGEDEEEGTTAGKAGRGGV